MFLSFISLFLIILVVIGYSFLFKLLLIENKEYKQLKIYNYDFIYGLFVLSFLSILFNFITPLKNLTYLVNFFGIILFVFASVKGKIKINLSSLTLLLLFFIFISHTQGVGYDTQLYHLQIIKHNSMYKSIFGIANLEDRFAMNSSLHSLVSLFNFNFYGLKIIYIFNIIIYSFIVNEIFSENKILKSSSQNFLNISILFIFIYAFVHPFGNGTMLNSIGSPEVDIPASFLFIYGCFLFLRFFENNDFDIIKLLILISVLIFTIKINYLSISLLPLWIILVNKKLFKYIKLYLISFIFILTWSFKSFIASGCLVFPISFTCISTKWSMHADHVENYKNIIKSFARDTPDRLKFGDFNHTINSFDWFYPWFKEYFLKTEILYFTFIILILTFITILITFFIKKKINLPNYITIFLIMIFLSMIIWFQAPEIRFGYGTIISTLSISILIIMFNINFEILTLKINRILVILVMSLLIFKNSNNYNSFNDTFQRNFIYEDWSMVQKSSDIKIFIPPEGVFCSDFNNFCTYKNNLSLEIEKKKYLYFLN